MAGVIDQERALGAFGDVSEAFGDGDRIGGVQQVDVLVRHPHQIRVSQHRSEVTGVRCGRNTGAPAEAVRNAAILRGVCLRMPQPMAWLAEHTHG